MVKIINCQLISAINVEQDILIGECNSVYQWEGQFGMRVAAQLS